MTIAPMIERLTVHSTPVSGVGELLDLLPSPEGVFSWVHDGEGLVGWGQVARMTASGAERFTVLQDWWHSLANRLEVHDEVDLPGSGPVAFTSIGFGDTPGLSVLTVPRVVVGRYDGITWITEVGSAGGPERVVPVRPPRGLRYYDGQLPLAAWREAVNEAVRRMRARELNKVVLAHDLLALADEPLDPRFLLH
ncbi:MAG: isochorismate synthase, partial [Actinomycetota bacterium]|nr:isochorismate synthase [Actinomycetota bacterium]